MPSSRALVLALSCSLALPLSAAPAGDKPADPKPPDAQHDTKEAKKHFKAGQTHYSIGEFAEAAAEFREAYRLRPEPAILFNIGQAMRQLNDFRQAFFYYSQYLSQRPDAPNRDEVEQFMAAMKGQIDADDALKAAQAAPAAPGNPDPRGKPDEPAIAPQGDHAEARSAAALAVAPALTPAPAVAPASASVTPPAPALAVAPASTPAPASEPGATTFWTGPHIGGVAAGGGAAALGLLALVAHSSAASSADELNQKYQAGTLTTQDASLKSAVDSKGKLATLGAIGGAALLVAGALLVFAF